MYARNKTGTIVHKSFVEKMKLMLSEMSRSFTTVKNIVIHSPTGLM